MKIRHRVVRRDLRESKIIKLENHQVEPGDIFIPTNVPDKVYVVDTNKAVVEDKSNREIVYVTNKELTMDTQAKSVVAELFGELVLDSATSEFQGNQVGATMGTHTYTFSGYVNTVDVLAGGIPITPVLGNNVEVSGNHIIKNISGNSWNASFSSLEKFNPEDTDFAFSWEVESVSGAIREMAGLDNNPTQNNRHSSIEHAVYQVNKTFHSRVYEGGSAIKIPNYQTFNLQVGDRVGIRVVDKKAIYFVIRNGEVIDMYTSSTPVTGEMFFKAAFNRGNTSSGASALGNVQFHTTTKVSNNQVTISGQATDEVTEEDRTALMDALGIIVLEGSTYATLRLQRHSSVKFDNMPVDYNHSYVVITNQDIKTDIFNT